MIDVLPVPPSFESANMRRGRTRIPVAAFRGVVVDGTQRFGSANVPNPVVPPQSVAGNYLRGTHDDWYYRVHVIPASIALGNLVSDQVRPVKLWNAYFHGLTLAAVNLDGGDGITVIGPGAMPIPFAALQQRMWQLTVHTDGPPVIDAALTYQFLGLPAITIPITGNRLSAWMLPPDWAQPVTETLAWLTDVQQSVDGSESRMPLREAPRRDWEFTVVGDRRERQIVEQALFDWTARNWALPVWPDVTWLSERLPIGSMTVPVPGATLMDYRVGGLAMLWQSVSDYELVEVAGIDADLIRLARPTARAVRPGGRVYPCRTARLTDAPRLERLTDQHLRAPVRFTSVEPCDWPAQAPAATYRGYPVLEQRPDWNTNPTAEFDRQLVLIDGDVGPVVIDDISGRAWPLQTQAMLLHGRVAKAEHRGLLYYLQGRAAGLWVPSWADDVTLVEPTLSTSSGIVVEWCGVARFGRAQPGRRYLRIELNDGRVLYRRLIQATEMDGEREHLQLDSALGIALAPGQLRLISWMTFARLRSDTIEIAHEHDSEGVARSQPTFVGIPADEDAL